ncbi:unnamed protein product [Cuscuta campestris]|uniref:Uncharacterized protein n=1 Tax=Cuscuta campestris TaxID=132261 RepID=A0A484MQP1_9ASTE|nr:unnamed protein product [Cuscuta campestris]
MSFFTVATQSEKTDSVRRRKVTITSVEDLKATTKNLPPPQNFSPSLWSSAESPSSAEFLSFRRFSFSISSPYRFNGNWIFIKPTSH